MSLQKEILSRIKNLTIDCPECEHMWSDDQYCCTTCWSQGGQGKLNVYNYLKDNQNIFSKDQKTIFIVKGLKDNVEKTLYLSADYRYSEFQVERYMESYYGLDTLFSVKMETNYENFLNNPPTPSENVIIFYDFEI